MDRESEITRASPARRPEDPASDNGIPLRVLLVDDHASMRRGLALLLREEHTVEVVGEATNGREAVDLASTLLPDVVIMDMSMPVMNGDEAARRIKRNLPQVRIIGFSMGDEPAMRERMYQAGAESYILKTASADDLLAAIRGKEMRSV